MKKIHFMALCLCSVFIFCTLTKLKSQCIISPGSYSNAGASKGDKLMQSFTATCDGTLTQLGIQLYYRSIRSYMEMLNIGIYKGDDPTDSKSKLLFKDNVLPGTQGTNLNVNKNVSLEKGSKYYFIISNLSGNSLPELMYNYSLSANSKGGLAFSSFNNWSYQQVYPSNKGLNILFSATVSPPINESHSICKGGVLQILHYDTTNSTHKTGDIQGLLNLTVNGDTALITCLNYGVSSFFYAKNNVPNQLYKCNIHVIDNEAPSIAASRQILTNAKDTITLTAEENTNKAAMGFDGNTYITVPNNKFKFFNGFTFESWVSFDNVNDNNPQYLFSRGPDANGNSFGIYINDGKIGFNNTNATATNNNNISFSSFVSLKSNKWHHIAVTYKVANDGYKVFFYIDGEKANTENYTTSIIDNEEDLFIGVQRGINNSFPLGYFEYKLKGRMDEVRIWNVCRTEDEIKANYTNAILGSSKGLIAYYNFDNNVNNNAALDASINHNNAFINSNSNVYVSNSNINLNSESIWKQGSVNITKCTYLWNNNATQKNIVITNPDSYSYKLTDLTTGCTASSQEIKITLQSK